MTKPLKLLAQDVEDLVIVSAALQDAIAKIGDIKYDSKGRRLTISFNRYCWEGPSKTRVRSVLQVDSVLEVQSQKLRLTAKDAVVEFLGATFEPSDAPGGKLVLAFAGGGALRVRVECVDAILADVSMSWPTKREPHHEI